MYTFKSMLKYHRSSNGCDYIRDTDFQTHLDPARRGCPTAEQSFPTLTYPRTHTKSQPFLKKGYIPQN